MSSQARAICSASRRSSRTGCCHEDGTYVRYLEVGAVNPLVMEPGRGRAGLRGVRADRRAAARPPVAAALRAGRAARARGAARGGDAPLRAGGRRRRGRRRARARARRSAGSAIAQEQSIRSERAERRAAAAALPRGLPVAPGGPRHRSAHAGPSARIAAAGARARRARLAAPRRRRSARTSRRMGLPARRSTGAEVLDLLHEPL